MPLVARGALRPVIDGVPPLAAVGDAVRRLEDGDVRGELVIAVSKGEGSG